MTRPLATVEIAYTMSGGSPVWTRLPDSLVLEILIESGRQSDLNQFEASTCTLKMSNRFRHFDRLYRGVKVNWLTNPSFEVDTTGWTSFKSGGGTLFNRVVDNPGSFGLTQDLSDAAGRINPTGAADTYAGAEQAVTGLEVGGYLTLSGWFRRQFGVGIARYIMAAPPGTDYEPSRFEIGDQGGTNEWVYTTKTFRWVPANLATTAVVAFWIDAQGIGNISGFFRGDMLQLECQSGPQLLQNWSFETNTFFWTPGTGNAVALRTLASDPGKWPLGTSAGTKALRVTSDGSGFLHVYVDSIPITAERKYRFSMGIRNSMGASKTVNVQIDWYTSAFVFISSSVQAVVTGDIAVTAEVTGISPANAAHAVLMISGGLGSSGSVDIDAAHFGLYHDPTRYTDGRQTHGRWDGATNNSASFYGGSNSLYQSVRPIRVAAVLNGVTNYQFTGNIEEVRQTWEARTFGDPIAIIQCSDFVKQLSLKRARVTRSQERSGDRLKYFIDLHAINPPSKPWASGYGAVELRAKEYDNTTVLAIVREIEQSEGGLFWISPDGSARFKDRNALNTESRYLNVQAYFSNLPSTGVLPYVGIGVNINDSNVWNYIDINIQSNHGLVTSSDAGSITEFGRRSLTIDSVAIDDFHIQEHADQLRDRFLAPREQVTIVIEGDLDDAIWTAVWALELADRIEVTLVTPGDTSAPDELWQEEISYSLFIDRISRKYSRRSWQIIYTGTWAHW